MRCQRNLDKKASRSSEHLTLFIGLALHLNASGGDLSEGVGRADDVADDTKHSLDAEWMNAGKRTRPREGVNTHVGSGDLALDAEPTRRLRGVTERLCVERVPHCDEGDWFIRKKVDPSRVSRDGGVGFAIFVAYCEAMGLEPEAVWGDIAPFYSSKISGLHLGSHHEILLKAFLGVNVQIVDAKTFEWQAENDATWKKQEIVEDDDLPFHIVRGARWKRMHVEAFENLDPNKVPNPDHATFAGILRQRFPAYVKKYAARARHLIREIDLAIDEAFYGRREEWSESFDWVFDTERIKFLRCVGERLTRRFDLAADVAEYRDGDGERFARHCLLAWRLRAFLHSAYFEELSRHEQTPDQYSLPDSYGPPGAMHGMRAGTMLAVSSELAKMDCPVAWWAWKALFNEATLANKSDHSPHNVQFVSKANALCWKFAKKQPSAYRSILNSQPRAHIAFHLINDVAKRVILPGPPVHYDLDTAAYGRRGCIDAGKVVHLGLDKKAKNWREAVSILRLTTAGRTRFLSRLEEALEKRDRSDTSKTGYALKKFARKLRSDGQDIYPRELWRAIGMDFSHHESHDFIPQVQAAKIKVKKAVD